MNHTEVPITADKKNTAIARRPTARTRVFALVALSAAVASALMMGACSAAARAPATTRGDLPGKPDVSPTFLTTGTGIEISWSAPASNAAITGYDVRWRMFEDEWDTAPGLSGSTESYAIDDLTAGLEYLIQVRALSSAGSGDWSDTLVYAPEKNLLFRAVAVAPDDSGAPGGGGSSSTRAEGTEGDDYIYVEYDSEYYNHDYIVHGLGGDDWIWTGAGNDSLYGNEGNDALVGGDGNDTLEGGTHNDYLSGGWDNDILRGGSGSDDLDGGSGADFLDGGEGDDLLDGGYGDDSLDGGAGVDRFVFDRGEDADTIRDFSFVDDVIDLLGIRTLTSFDELQPHITADGDATVIDLTTYDGGTIRLDGVGPTALDADNFDLLVWLYGDEGDNTLIGERPDNNIDGLGGNDTIVGGPGFDQIVGGSGDDTLTGGFGYGEDTFIFAAGHGNDTITDFARENSAIVGHPGSPGPGQPPSISLKRDVIDLTQLPSISEFSELSVTTDGTNTLIDLTAHGGGTILLERMPIANLSRSQFRFHE